jgi:hypothetical protein
MLTLLVVIAEHPLPQFFHIPDLIEQMCVCVCAGGTLYDSIDAVPKLTDGLKRALNTAKRIPFVQISRPAKILDKALAKPVRSAEASDRAPW